MSKPELWYFVCISCPAGWEQLVEKAEKPLFRQPGEITDGGKTRFRQKIPRDGASAPAISFVEGPFLFTAPFQKNPSSGFCAGGIVHIDRGRQTGNRPKFRDGKMNKGIRGRREDRRFFSAVFPSAELQNRVFGNFEQ